MTDLIFRSFSKPAQNFNEFYFVAFSIFVHCVLKIGISYSKAPHSIDKMFRTLMLLNGFFLLFQFMFIAWIWMFRLHGLWSVSYKHCSLPEHRRWNKYKIKTVYIIKNCARLFLTQRWKYYWNWYHYPLFEVCMWIL